jgi:hypothetical protein
MDRNPDSKGIWMTRHRERDDLLLRVIAVIAGVLALAALA